MSGLNAEAGPAAALCRRFLKVIAPITLVVVVVSTLIVIAAVADDFRKKGRRWNLKKTGG